MNWCEAPYIFNPGTKWRWLVSFTWHPCHTLVFFRASVDLEFIWAWWQRETSCPYLNHTPAVQPIASDFTDSCHGAQWREGISQTCFLLPLHCLCYVSIKRHWTLLWIQVSHHLCQARAVLYLNFFICEWNTCFHQKQNLVIH